MLNINAPQQNARDSSPTQAARELMLSALQHPINHGENLMVTYIEDQRWDILKELQNLLHQAPPAELASTSPMKFKTWMDAITKCYLLGWDKIVPPQSK